MSRIPVIGNGSNLIVRDGGVIGLVIALGERFSHISKSMKITF